MIKQLLNKTLNALRFSMFLSINRFADAKVLLALYFLHVSVQNIQTFFIDRLAKIHLFREQICILFRLSNSQITL
jgi:hypothetical protein